MSCGKAPFCCGYGDAVYPANPVDERLGVEAPAFDNFHMPLDPP